MNNSKYKPKVGQGGWFRESVPHSLARRYGSAGRMSKQQSAEFLKGFKATGREMPIGSIQSKALSNALQEDKEINYHDLSVEVFGRPDSVFQIDKSPTRHEDEFYDDMEDEFKKLVEQYKSGEIDVQDLNKGLKNIQDNYEGILDDDLSEPEATIYFDDEETPNIIGYYSEMIEDDDAYDFDPNYKSTDAWRGHYDVKAKDWTNINSDCILSMSEDEQNLKKFDDEARKILKENNIKYARVFTRTSNVFSTGLDMFVKNKDSKKANGLIKRLKEVYRDPEKFTQTALTGKNPSDLSKEDKMFVGIARGMLQ